MGEITDSDPAGHGDNKPPSPPEIKEADKPKSKSKKRRLLVAVAILFIVSTLVFVALFVYYYTMPHDAPGVVLTAQLCNTPNCIITAGMMAKLMNVTADPCTDFAEFACGRFFKEVKLKEGLSSSIGAFVNLNVANQELLKEIITESISSTDPQYLIKIKRFYKSCLDLDQIDKIGFSPLLNNTGFIQDWPTLNPAWNESDFNLNDVVARYSALFISPLFGFNSYITFEDRSTGKLQINPPSLDLDWIFFLLPGAQVKALKTYMTELAVALGAEANVSAEDAKDVVELQGKLANIIRSTIGTGLNMTTLSKVGDTFPNIDIAGALRAAFAVADIALPDDTILISYPGEYLTLLNKQINKFSPRALQNLFALKYAMSRLEEASKYLREIRAKFNKVVDSSYNEDLRWKVCVGITNTVFKTGLNKQYVDRTFTDQAKDYVEGMVADLKDVFGQMLAESTWMTNDTTAEAYRKLEKMEAIVGYPDDYDFDYYVDVFYENYTMTEDNYYNNGDLILKLYTINKMRTMVSPDYESEPDVYTVNAFYSPFYNQIRVYAGILQPPMFSLTFPDYFNYGAIGSIIGHEIIHAFDIKGSLLDADGNPNNWWEDDDRAEYLNKTQCLIDQYSKFYIEEVNMTINGENTVAETLGDTVGLKMAFRAYKEEQERTGGQLALPGLNLTQDQLFFLSFGQLWCTKDPALLVAFILLVDNHPPGKFRFIGPLQNSEGFAQAYNCPRGSYMNPAVKCGMW